MNTPTINLLFLFWTS